LVDAGPFGQLDLGEPAEASQLTKCIGASHETQVWTYERRLSSGLDSLESHRAIYVTRKALADRTGPQSPYDPLT
jgi:hypothetical protein